MTVYTAKDRSYSYNNFLKSWAYGFYASPRNYTSRHFGVSRNRSREIRNTGCSAVDSNTSKIADEKV